MTRRWITLLTGILGMALLGVGCATTPRTAHIALSAEAPRSTTTSPKGEIRAAAPAQGDVSLATVIENIGLNSYSSVFAGAEKLPDGQVAVHVIVGRDAAFRAALPPVTNTPSGPSYFFVPAGYSIDELNALTEQIANDGDSLKSRGINLAGWGPDYASNTVVIHLQHYDPNIATYLQSRYGPAVHVATDSTPQPPAAGIGGH